MTAFDFQRWAGLLPAAVLVAALCAPDAAGASPGGVIGPEVLEELAVTERVRVMVSLRIPELDPRDLPALRRAVSVAQDEALRALGPDGFELERRFAHVPALGGWIASAGVERARAAGIVRRVDVDRGGSGALTEAVPFINANDVHTFGFTGEGVVVAVLDSGLDTDHLALGDDLLDEACFCASRCCPNGRRDQLGPGAAEDDHGHGSNVTGVVTSSGIVAPLGVAPDAGIVAIKVLDSNLSFQTSADVVAGLDWILSDHPEVRVVNMSLGTGTTYPGDCDNDDAVTQSFATAIDALRARGTITFASAGNQTLVNAMSAPACVANSVSVGAVHDSNLGPVNFGTLCSDLSTAPDRVACFSNASPTTDLLGPGVFVTSAGLAGGTRTSSGTSQAAPAAAACAADLLEAVPTLTPGEIEAALESTGVQVTDHRTGRTYPRVDCLAALNDVFAPPTPTVVADNLTPCDLYDAGSSWSASLGVNEQAFAFTPSHAGTLLAVRVALGPGGGPTASVSLRVAADAAGVPGATLEAWSPTATGGVEEATGNGSTQLVAGTRYWLLVASQGANDVLWFWNDFGRQGMRAEFVANPGRWDLYPGSVEGAFRVTVDSGTLVDRDGDGITDGLDNCPDIGNPGQGDSDGDCAGDPCDNCGGLYNPRQEDQDGDQSGDACDNCLTISNPGQDNHDSDPAGNACDNCWTADNPLQEDSDGDCPAPPYSVDPLCGDVCESCPAGTPPEASPGSLLVERRGDDLYVFFVDSLVPGLATHYNLYRGSFPGGFDLHSPAPGGCGAVGAPIGDPGAAVSGENLYYLVVAACPGLEGSYGYESDGSDRPPSPSPCP